MEAGEGGWGGFGGNSQQGQAPGHQQAGDSRGRGRIFEDAGSRQEVKLEVLVRFERN